MGPKLIIREAPADTSEIHVHTNFGVAEAGSTMVVNLGSQFEPTGDQVGGLVRLLVASGDRLGLIQIRISSHRITLVKFPAYSWIPILRVVIETVAATYLDGKRPRVVYRSLFCSIINRLLDL